MERKNKINQLKMNTTVHVPMVMQLETLECGAACLTMILAYFGKWLPIEQVRKECGVSRDGSNALNILKAARSYGLNAKGYRYDADSIVKSGKFPCIIHWNFNHYVVLNGFHKGKAIINDPARGKISVLMEDFYTAFNGVCLLFEPTEKFECGGKPRSVWSFVKQRLTGTKASFAFVLVTTVIASIIGIIQPAFSRIFLDEIVAKDNDSWFYPFIIGLFVITFIQILVEAIRSVHMLRITGKFAIYANSSYMWHVLRLPMEFFSQRLSGDITARQNSNEGIASFLLGTLAPLCVNFLFLLFYLFVMLKYSVLLTGISVFSLFVNLIVAKIISSKRVNITRVQMRDSGKLSGTTVAGIEMIETIKASGAENGFFQKWSGYQASVNAQTVKYAKLNQYLGEIPTFISSIATVAILITGVYLTMNGRFTAGMILAFQALVSRLVAPASSLIKAGQSIQEMRTNMERIEDVMNYPTDVEYSDTDLSDETEYDKLHGKIELRNVTFGYSKLAEPVIKNFSMKIEHGQSIAIIGGSGCGKSTLSKLISGLYEPWSGEILFDEKPISAIKHEIFTSSLAVVDQDIILFEDTIANNIKMWDDSIADFEMILAARDSQIHDEIITREDGYNYRMSEGGHDFSGGQRQRLEIARVLAQDPTIVIMDEATSALDALTEHNVVEAIRQRGITTIVIAHRLSTIRDCDEIIVLDKGNVIERGKHDELYQKKGLYYNLVSIE